MRLVVATTALLAATVAPASVGATSGSGVGHGVSARANSAFFQGTPENARIIQVDAMMASGETALIPLMTSDLPLIVDEIDGAEVVQPVVTSVRRELEEEEEEAAYGVQLEDGQPARRLNDAKAANLTHCVPADVSNCADLVEGNIQADAPYVVPCGECVKIVQSSLDFPAGLDVHGALLFPDNHRADITSKFVFVQGLLKLRNDKPVGPVENLGVVFNLTGTEDTFIQPHEHNPTDCPAGGCPAGKKPFVVAGGQLDIKAFPAVSAAGNECKTWAKVHSLVTAPQPQPSPDQIDPVVLPPAGCHDSIVDHSFDLGDNRWTAGEWQYAGATCTMETDPLLDDGNTSFMSVENRLRNYQGPSYDLTRHRDCLLEGVDYLFTAHIKLDKKDADGNPMDGQETTCKSSDKNCLVLQERTRYELENGDDYVSYGVDENYNTQKRGSAYNYGEWFDFTGIVRFADVDVTESNVYTMLALYGPEKGVDISVQSAKLSLPSAASYDKQDPADTCTELIRNGDAEANGFHYFPMTRSHLDSRLQVLEEDDGAGGKNKYFSLVHRGWHDKALRANVNSACFEVDAVYSYSLRIRVHENWLTNGPSDRNQKLNIIRCRDAEGAGCAEYSVGDCGVIKPVDGWVTCSGQFRITDSLMGDRHLFDIQTDYKSGSNNEKMDIDIDDFSVAFDRGTPKGIVLPEDVVGCWDAGSEVLLTPHSFRYWETQTLTVEAVTALTGGKTQIDFTEGFVAPTTQSDPHGNPEMAVEAALLTRNVKIQGSQDDVANPTQSGAYLAFRRTSDHVQTLEGVEFRNVGQASINHRWPIHVQECGNLPGTSISKNSIVDSYMRCLVIADSHNMTVDGNVAFRHEGHCYSTLHGSERDNTISRNLGAHTERTLTPTGSCRELPGSPWGWEECHWVSTFYIRGMWNDFTGNVAAGSYRRGFWFRIMPRITDESDQYYSGWAWDPRRWSMGDYKFKDNIAHSNYHAQGLLFQDMQTWNNEGHAVVENFHAYRNRYEGLLLSYSRGVSIKGGFFADNRRAIRFARSDVAPEISGAVIKGETQTQRDLVLMQKVEQIGCSSGDPVVGIALPPARNPWMNPNAFNSEGARDLHLHDLTFSDFDATKCGPYGKPIFAAPWDRNDDHFEFSTYTTNLTFHDSRGSTVDLCYARDKGIKDVIFTDLDGSLNSVDEAVSGSNKAAAVVTDNASMKAFAGGACVDYPDTCMSYCKDSCLRVVSFQVDHAGTEDWTMLVTEQGGLGRSHAVTPSEWQQYDDRRKNEWSRPRRFSVPLPTGNFTAEFLDGEGNRNWPKFYREFWDTPPPCSGHAEPGDVTVIAPELKEGECENLFQNGDGEAGGFLPWHFNGDADRRGSRLKHVSSGGVGNSSAVMMSKRAHYNGAGIGQYLDMRCIKANYGRQYEIRGQVKLMNSDGDAISCDPNSNNHGLACPEVYMAMNHHTNMAMDLNADTFRQYTPGPYAESVRPHNDDGFSPLQGVFTVTDRVGMPMEQLMSVYLYISHFKADQFILDDMTVKLVKPEEGACQELVTNGDFKTGDSEGWDTLHEIPLSLVEGADGEGDYALKGTRGTHTNQSPRALLKTGCMKKGVPHVVKAKIKLEDANGNLVQCKATYNNDVLLRCPEMVLRNQEYYVYPSGHVQSRYYHMEFPANPTSADGWTVYEGLYLPNQYDEDADYLDMWFEDQEKTLAITVDDVSIAPLGIDMCDNLILQSNFEDGLSTYWETITMNTALIDMHSPGADGTDDYALRLHSRDRSWANRGVKHISDARCLRPYQHWQIDAKFKLLNSTGHGVSCDPSEKSALGQNNCPFVRMELRGCTDPITGEPIDDFYERFFNEQLNFVWDPDAYNPFRSGENFLINAEAASCTELTFFIAEVNVDWDVLVDDISVTLKTVAPTDAPWDVPTASPATLAPVGTGTSEPSSSPSNSPTMISEACPAAGEQRTVQPGPISLDIAGPELLCTLARVTKTASSGDVSALIPLARSYDGVAWGNAAGDKADTILTDGWDCYAEACEAVLPDLEADSGDEYVLTSYAHTLPEVDQVSRLLSAATFGVTQQDLTEWNYAGPMDQTMTAWVSTQMDGSATPPTSHREFWRRRANARATSSKYVGRVEDPCDSSSRWRRFAFSSLDTPRGGRTRPFVATPLIDEATNVTGGYLLSVDGQARTVVNNLVVSNAGYETYQFKADVLYTLCRADSGVGNRLEVRLGDDMNRCVSIAGGNPAVDFTGRDDLAGLQRTLTGLPETCVDCDDSDKLKVTWSWSSQEQTYLLDDPVSTLPTPGLCAADGAGLPRLEDSEPAIFGRLQDETTWLLYDPVLELVGNGPSSPLADGGGLVELTTEGRTLCSNAPRTFLNDATCALSTEANACGDVAAPVVEIPLDDANIRKLHDLTGQYVYGIRGLVVQQVNANTSQVTYQVPSPCIAGRRSRWKRSSGVCTHPTALGMNTNHSLVTQLLKWGEDDTNPVMRDIFFPSTGTMECDGADDGTVGMNITVVTGTGPTMTSECFTHVHRDYLSVFDMTYWTQDDTHPGNMHAMCDGHYNPIKKWMDLRNYSVLTFPSTYPDEPFGHLVGNHSDHVMGDGDGTMTHDHNSTMMHDHNDTMHHHDNTTMMNDTTTMMDGMMPMDPCEQMMMNDMMMMDGMMGGGSMMGMEEHLHHHPMSRWDTNNVKFTYVGRMHDVIRFRDLPNELRLDQVARHYGAAGDAAGAGILVCGSPGEVPNDPSVLPSESFDVTTGHETTDTRVLVDSRRTTWTTTVVTAQDQLRQRMAFALSQILVVVPGAISSSDRNSEMYVNYYDIFVRNAFGNYRDVIKEVAFSAMMAENLSYIQSKSHAYVRENLFKLSFADENFAREIMQLFTIGMVQLNVDGTPIRDPSTGIELLTYSNNDIMNYARVWTGFDYQKKRGNAEEILTSRNRMDPMKIEPRWRDKFPKRTLNGGYIGDGYPLCADLPDKMFLNKGATYRFLGGSKLPELMHADPAYLDDDNMTEFNLDATSELRAALCSEAGTDCKTPSENEITLSATLPCAAGTIECSVDAVRVVKVADDTYWEYVRPPCVEQAFYSGGKKLSRRTNALPGTVCANPLLPAAMDACCVDAFSLRPIATMHSLYDDERVTYSTAAARCSATNDAATPNTPARVCDYATLDPSIPTHKTGYHWTDKACSVYVKVTADAALPGWIAVVHETITRTNKALHVDDDSLNFFPANWEGGAFPTQEDDCGGEVSGCVNLPDGGCRCETTVVETSGYGGMPPSAGEALTKLVIGAVDPSARPAGTYETETDPATGIVAHKKVASSDRRRAAANFDQDTVFAVLEAHTGRTHFLKNVVSTVRVTGTSYSFRNAPHFMSFVPTETDVRDAQHETEAALDHYFYQENTAPFLATRFIQRFGIASNPAPAYVEAVATAFRTGRFVTAEGTANEVTFGDGAYGDLAATSAAVLLRPEARSVVLDADPASGALLQPLLKIIAALRNLGFAHASGDAGDLIPLRSDLESAVGQSPHDFETVFSHFLWDFRPTGRTAPAGLFAPEAMVLDMPKITGLLNGLFSMVRFGLTGGSGFGQRYEGNLGYAPEVGATAADVVNELATLMTAGRLSADNRKIIKDAYEAESNAATGLHLAQQLVASTAEFHSTNLVTKSGTSRTDYVEDAATQDTSYKAVVYLLLGGGCDSYNMLVPHTCEAENNETASLDEQYYEVRGEVALVRETLLQIDAGGVEGTQPCSTFGLHPSLTALAALYRDGDALLVANAGSLSHPVTKDRGPTYWGTTVGGLFSHSNMQNSARQVDLYEMWSGTGVLGRMRDMLNRDGHRTSAIAVDGQSVTLIGRRGQSAGPGVVGSNGVPQFNANPTSPDMALRIADLNNATSSDSGFMAEGWSAALHESLSSNEALRLALDDAELRTTFPNTGLGKRLGVVTRMMQTAETRSIDRDLYYVSMGGFDTHSMVEVNLQRRFDEINGAVAAFTVELKALGLWESTVLVETSDFARTLTPNTGKGTDHAWGGNYFILGGGLNGGKILGKYPHDILPSGPYNIGRGRIIPTTPWDSIWNGVAQWMGVTGEADLTEVCPNRGKFGGDTLFDAADIFNVTSGAASTGGGERKNLRK